jgi:hypothetical protein
VTGLIPASEAAEGLVLALPRTADPVPGRHRSYSEDTAIDNVSSPKPRTRRAYSEDTQMRAYYGGSTCGYQPGFALSARPE